MCLIAIAQRCIPDHRLLLLANRDEFHNRPTAASHWWDDSALLAGQDLQAGGTWLGVHRDGRVAAVTNFREVPAVSGARSRGELPVQFLSGSVDAARAAAAVLQRGAQYGGFNLLLWDGDRLVWCSNRHPRVEVLDQGIHLLSNHLLNTPWPKVRRLREKLQAACAGPEVDAEQWLELLCDRTHAEDLQLPDTGVGLEHERMLSPVFIQGERYGTRCSTLLTIRNDGAAAFTEVNYDHTGQATDRRQFGWQL